MKFQIPYCYFSTSNRTLASTFIQPDFFHDIFKIKTPWICSPKFSLSLFAVCLQGWCQFLFMPLPPETQHKEHWTWSQRSIFIHLCDLGQWVSAFHRASTSSPRKWSLCNCHKIRWGGLGGSRYPHGAFSPPRPPLKLRGVECHRSEFLHCSGRCHVGRSRIYLLPYCCSVSDAYWQCPWLTLKCLCTAFHINAESSVFNWRL